MASIQIGATGVFTIQPGSTVTQGPDGSAQAQLTYTGTWSNVIGSLPSPLQAHPVYPALLLYEFALTRLEGDLGSVACTYRGILTSSPSAYTQQDYEVAQTSEPIETHPLFSYPVDYPPVSPTELKAIDLALENNAAYTSSNAAAQLLHDLKCRGMESYLRVGGAFRQSYVQGTIPAIPGSVGKIVSSLPTNCPAPVATGANYLYAGFSWHKSGGLVQVQESYAQSGPGGWRPEIYS